MSQANSPTSSISNLPIISFSFGGVCCIQLGGFIQLSILRMAADYLQGLVTWLKERMRTFRRKNLLRNSIRDRGPYHHPCINNELVAILGCEDSGQKPHPSSPSQQTQLPRKTPILFFVLNSGWIENDNRLCRRAIAHKRETGTHMPINKTSLVLRIRDRGLLRCRCATMTAD